MYVGLGMDIQGKRQPLMLRSITKPLLRFSQRIYLLKPVERKIFLMLLIRVGLNWHVVRIVMLNQDKISQLIRPTKTGIWLVRFIKHWQVRVLRWRGDTSSSLVIVILALMTQKVNSDLLVGGLYNLITVNWKQVKWFEAAALNMWKLKINWSSNWISVHINMPNTSVE